VLGDLPVFDRIGNLEPQREREEKRPRSHVDQREGQRLVREHSRQDDGPEDGDADENQDDFVDGHSSVASGSACKGHQGSPPG
jgi:hypothetical protein